MCGRYSFSALAKEVEERFHVKIDGSTWRVRYNCAPSQQLAVITDQNPTEISYQRWGLIPHWSKDPIIGNKLINARLETAHEKPAFSESFVGRHCLVLSTGFYEWKKTGSLKQPQFIRLKNHPIFTMAGIWDRWQSPQGSYVDSFSILTTEPNSLMRTIHNRMPVILTPSAEKQWLTTQDPIMMKKLVVPIPSEAMEAFPVSNRVNSPAAEGPELILPYSGGQISLF